MLHLVKPFNFILACDSYKVNHWKELPPGVSFAQSTIVPRKVSKYSDVIVAMGQTFVTFILTTVLITHEMIDEAEIEITQQGYEFNREGWEIIVNELGGRLPLALYGVEEGRIIRPQTPIAAISNTDPRFAWLPTYVETWAQGIVWKMSTVASVCRAAREKIKKKMIQTGADMSMLNYKLHNFGDRGADSPEEAPVLAGMAHAALFDGSDCTRANGYIKVLYKTAKAYTSSVEATEHSVMCANSDAANRDDFGAAQMAVKRLHAVVARTKRGVGIPLMSVVIDTYNSRRFVREYMGGVFKDEIINSGGVMVMRPDSGDPTVEPGLVGYDIQATFGVTVNDAGYKVVHPATSVIQGDGIRIDTIDPVLEGWVDEAGFSMDRFTLGMGGGVTHFGSRDDFSFSMKSTVIKVEGKWVRLLKEPITDIGKKSLTGLIQVHELPNGELETYDALDESSDPYEFPASVPGWRLWAFNGTEMFEQSFDDVQARARA